MSEIVDVRAFEVLDLRNPTVMAGHWMTLVSAWHALRSSTGTREALELRDGDPSRYLGKGVLTAVGHANGPIRELLVGHDALDQAGVDHTLIGQTGQTIRRSSVPMPFWLLRWLRPKPRRCQPESRYQHIAELSGCGHVSPCAHDEYPERRARR